MVQNKMKHNLPEDIDNAITNVLSETAVTHWTWWEIAFTLRAEVQKLMDRQESVSDPIHHELNTKLIDYGVEAYNNLISAFMTAGLRTEGMKFAKRHQRSVQIIRSALDDPKKTE